jgi:serine O-acetyltransferase
MLDLPATVAANGHPGLSPAAESLPAANLPTRQSMSRLADWLLHLVFPSFSPDEDPALAGQLPYARLLRPNAAMVRERKLTAFKQELHLALGRCLAAGDEPDPGRRATRICTDALAALPEVRERLQLDALAAFNGDPSVRSVLEAVHCLPGLTAVALQRFAHVLHVLGAPILPRLLTEVGHSRTGCDIHPGARLGRSFFIDHATGVVIGETATIGDHVKIYHGVTLGAKSFERDESGALVRGAKRHPDVGDHVTIFAHATILGGDTRIGAGSIIGANVWLAKSIPPGSVAYVTGAHVVVQPRGHPGNDWEI